MSISESRRVLRRLELEAYACVVTALRAQGQLTLEKKSVLTQLSQQLSISTDRHHAEVRRAICDDDLCYIADCVSGTESKNSWLPEARRLGRGNPKLVARHSLSTSTQAQALTALNLAGIKGGGGVSAKGGGGVSTKTDHVEGSTEKKLPLQVQSALKIVLANHANAAGGGSTTKSKVQPSSSTSTPSPAPPPSTAPIPSPLPAATISIGCQTLPYSPPEASTSCVGVQVDIADEPSSSSGNSKGLALEDGKEKGVSMEGKGKSADIADLTDTHNQASVSSDHPMKDRSTEDRPIGNRSTESRPTEDHPIEDRLTENHPTEDRPTGDHLMEDHSTEDRPIEDRPTEDHPTVGKESCGEKELLESKVPNSLSAFIPSGDPVVLTTAISSMDVDGDISRPLKRALEDDGSIDMPLSKIPNLVKDDQQNVLLDNSSTDSSVCEKVPSVTGAVSLSHDQSVTTVSLPHDQSVTTVSLSHDQSVATVSLSHDQSVTTVSSLPGNIVSSKATSSSPADKPSPPMDTTSVTLPVSDTCAATMPSSTTPLATNATPTVPIVAPKAVAIPLNPQTTSLMDSTTGAILPPVPSPNLTGTAMAIPSSVPILSATPTPVTTPIAAVSTPTPVTTPTLIDSSPFKATSTTSIVCTKPATIPSKPSVAIVSSSSNTIGRIPAPEIASSDSSTIGFVPVPGSVSSDSNTIGPVPVLVPTKPNNDESSSILSSFMTHSQNPVPILLPPSSGSVSDIHQSEIGGVLPLVSTILPHPLSASLQANLTPAKQEKLIPDELKPLPLGHQPNPLVSNEQLQSQLSRPHPSAVILSGPPHLIDMLQTSKPDKPDQLILSSSSPGSVISSVPSIKELSTFDASSSILDKIDPLSLSTSEMLPSSMASISDAMPIGIQQSILATPITAFVPSPLAKPSSLLLASSSGGNSVLDTSIKAPPTSVQAPPTLVRVPYTSVQGLPTVFTPTIDSFPVPQNVQPPLAVQQPHGVQSIFSFPSPLASTSDPLPDSSSLAGTPLDERDLLATVTSELGVESIDPSLLNMTDLLSFLPSDSEVMLEDLALTGGEISSDMVVLQEGMGGREQTTPMEFSIPAGKFEDFSGGSGIVATPESILEDVPLEIKDTVEAILKSQSDLDKM